MSDSKIVSLNGTEIPEPGTPDPNVISVLEQSLEEARSGKICGIVLIRTNHQLACDWYMTGHGVNSYAMLGALHSTAHHVAAEINEETEEV